MTKEQAIEILKKDKALCEFNPTTGESEPISEDCRKSAEALDMAIKALEQQPSEDCVSRAEERKIAKEMYLEVSNMDLDIHTISDCISYTSSKCRQVLEDKLQALPPVTPTQRWIPVSERLPKPNTAVLTYISTGPSETFCLAYWNDIQNYWEDWIGYKSIEKDRGYKVLAWQPLPKPYEEKRGNENDSN